MFLWVLAVNMFVWFLTVAVVRPGGASAENVIGLLRLTGPASPDQVDALHIARLSDLASEQAQDKPSPEFLNRVVRVAPVVSVTPDAGIERMLIGPENMVQRRARAFRLHPPARRPVE